MIDHTEELHATVAKLSKAANDAGKLIEVGWLALRVQAVPADASDIQLEEMRNAFFAGAQHLFGSIMSVMDSDREPTANDLRRMDMIDKELREFIADFTKRRIKKERMA